MYILVFFALLGSDYTAWELEKRFYTKEECAAAAQKYFILEDHLDHLQILCVLDKDQADH